MLALGLTSALPLSAQEGSSNENNSASATNEDDGNNGDSAKGDRKKGDGKKKKPTGRYYVKQGPCDLKKLPKRGVSQWTPAGEHIVHKVKYGQGLQRIANLYGFQGNKAFRVLWDSNPQLEELHLDRSGITVRIPACRTKMLRRELPPPPPPPEPEEEEEEEPEPSEPADDGPEESEPEPEPEPEEEAPPVAGDSVWDELAECESGGNWAANTGNGYYGGIQFSLPTWESVGGTGYPHEHSREEQIKRGKILQERSGWGQWPHCAAELGLL